MKLLTPAWRSRWWWWALPLVFCLLNGAFLSYHRSASRSGFRQIQNELKSQEDHLVTLVENRDRLASLLETAERNRAGVAEIYNQRLSTEESRVIQSIVEVKRLTRQAGLEPPSLTYGEQAIEDYGLVSKSIVFGVAGSYGKIRELVNLLELSDHFLILERIRLRESEGSRLSIDLVVSTLFAAPEVVDAAVAGSGGQP